MAKLFYLFSFLSLFSCKKEEPKSIEISSIKIEGVVLQANHKKWKANTTTTQGVKKMIQMVSHYEQGNDVKNYHLLKENLEHEFTNIFTNCTMKGEAHNQLHNYLKPMINYFDGLSSNDMAICKANFAQLKRHLLGYTNYFE